MRSVQANLGSSSKHDHGVSCEQGKYLWKPSTIPDVLKAALEASMRDALLGQGRRSDIGRIAKSAQHPNRDITDIQQSI